MKLMKTSAASRTKKADEGANKRDEKIEWLSSQLVGRDEKIEWLSSQLVGRDEKIEWLRSQLVGRDAMFETAFGKRILTYADHTASGRSLQYIENYIAHEALPFYGNTHTSDCFVGEKTTRMADEAAKYIRSCLRAGPNDALIFCGSGATAAIKRLQEVMEIAVAGNLRSRVIENLREEDRWAVFVGPFEHHSNLLSWRQSTAEVVEISVDGEGNFDMEALEAELTSSKYLNRPKLGSFSACSNVTGVISDTRTLARVLHKHGAFACFDFATSAPYVEIDMRSGELDGYDAIFLSPHKFLGGPGSPGILLMNKALYLLGSSPPSTCGGGVVCYVNGFSSEDTLYYADIEEREEAGTPQIIQKIRAALAFWVKEFVGFDAINLQESNYAKEAILRLSQHSSIKVLGNSCSENKLAIFSFLMYPGVDSASRMKCEKPLHGRFVAKLLNDLFGIQSRGGCVCASPYGHHLLGLDNILSLQIRSLIEKGYTGIKPAWTRVSFPYYMTNEEFFFILEAMEFIASYGHRFLYLYHFDWMTGDWQFRKPNLTYHLKQDKSFIKPNVFLGYKYGKSRSDKLNSERNVDRCYKRYVENAKRIYLSLPEDHLPMSIPKDVDPNLVRFRI